MVLRVGSGEVAKGLELGVPAWGGGGGRLRGGAARKKVRDGENFGRGDSGSSGVGGRLDELMCTSCSWARGNACSLVEVLRRVLRDKDRVLRGKVRGFAWQS